MTEYTTYTAFVSYSHKDDKWARWLLRALESYRVPRHLIGTAGTNGTVPEKLTRIFRDREELAAGACLDTKIQEALEQSQTLLVVCSPNAAHSYGVNQEIELFRKIRGDEHIFYIIKDGEPHARPRGLNPDLECFPKALIDHNLETTTAYGVPLAADARPQGDGKKMALLKVVAGILGVNLDALVRRDLQRRQRRLWGFMVAATAGMLLTTTLATQAYLASKKAEEALDHARRQQDEAESLIAYIVDDLGVQLWRRGHAELLKAMSVRILEHYDGQNSPDMGPEEIARKVRGLAMLARAHVFKGETALILERLEDLRKVTQEVLKKHPTQSAAVLDTHRHNLKLLSDVHLLQGNFDKATALIEERIDISDRLFELDPDRHPDDRTVLGNALIDLAWVKINAYQEVEEAEKLIRQGLAIRIAVGQMPQHVNTYRRLNNVAGGYHHLSAIQEITDTLPVAIASRQKCLDTYLERLELTPNHYMYKLLHYRFHNELAELQMNAGDTAKALETLSIGQGNLVKLLENKEENFRYSVMVARADLIRGQLFAIRGDWETAENSFRKAIEGLGRFHERSIVASDAQSWMLTAESLLALSVAKQGRLDEAQRLIDQSEQDLNALPYRLLRSVFGRKMLAIHANVRADIAHMLGLPDQAMAIRQEMIKSLAPKWRQSHPAVRFELMKAYIELGKPDAAAQISSNLNGIGFKRTDFLAAANSLSVETVKNQNQPASIAVRSQ